MTNAAKRPINWTLVLCIVAIALFLSGAGGIWKFAGERNELQDLGEQYQRESEVLAGQLAEVGAALERTEGLLAESRADSERALAGVGRSEKLAGELVDVLGSVSTGSEEIDELIGAIRRDIEAIIRELSGVPDGSGTADP